MGAAGRGRPARPRPGDPHRQGARHRRRPALRRLQPGGREHPRPVQILRQQRGRREHLRLRPDRGWGRGLRLLLHRRRLRHPDDVADPREPPDRPDQPLRRLQAGLRRHPALAGRGPYPALDGPALLQRRRGGPGRRGRRKPRAGNPPDPPVARRPSARARP